GPVRVGNDRIERRQKPRSEEVDGVSRTKGRAAHPRQLRAVPSRPLAGRSSRRDPRQSLARTARHEQGETTQTVARVSGCLVYRSRGKIFRSQSYGTERLPSASQIE